MTEFIELVVRPQFLVMSLAAIAALATVISLAMPLILTDRMGERMRVMAIERDKIRTSRLNDLAKDQSGRLRQAPKGIVQQFVDQFDLRAVFETETIRQKLKMAGLRGETPLYTYSFFRLIMPIAVTIVAFFYLFVLTDFSYPSTIKMMMALGAGFFGYYLPNIFLENMIQRRQQSVKNAFPDALDMLLICVQSGMSIEAAFGKVAMEVSSQSIELAEELSLTTAELSYLQDRRKAFENLGSRTGLPGVQAVATALVQAERYGTPVSQALRVMAKENREIRMSEAEKKAAALPPKLTVPMIIFFLPVLFVIILGPAAIQVWKLE
ncbi:MAG: type II secretion system F family protein [Pseudomonadota bacterium]